MADYAAQAVINTVLSHAFPDDPIIGEEDASDLRASSSDTGDAAALRARVVELAGDILAQPPLPPSSSDPSSIDGDSDGDGGGERAEWGLGRRWGAEALLKAIDRGKHPGGRTGRASLLLNQPLMFFPVIMVMVMDVFFFRILDVGSDRWDEGVLARRTIRRLSRAPRRCARRAGRHRLSEPPYPPTPTSIPSKHQYPRY